ncbi:Uncharacterised protein [Mycobacterium tuberculosis]|uniref:Uncharacterized protein n=2 Tax=Mycobacterium tuberculosis TaxID=1773 RepID=A0A654U0Z9_MYCTX|nr:Uncharacterised protein [Mycobacterium tuberculosis]
MGGEDDIGHAHQRVIGRQPFTGEVVQAGGGQLAATQGVDERIGVAQLGPGGVEKHRTVAHGRELLGTDHPDRVVGDRRVHGDDVSLGQQLVKAVAGVVAVRIVRDDPQAQPGQPPAHRATDGTQAHQPGSQPGDFGTAEPLIGDGAVAKDVAGPHICVRGNQVPGDGQQQGHRHLGDSVGVASRGVQHRYAGRGGAGDVDVAGIPAGGGDHPQPPLEHRATDRVTFHHKNIGGDGGDPVS